MSQAKDFSWVSFLASKNVFAILFLISAYNVVSKLLHDLLQIWRTTIQLKTFIV